MVIVYILRKSARRLKLRIDNSGRGGGGGGVGDFQTFNPYSPRGQWIENPYLPLRHRLMLIHMTNYVIIACFMKNKIYFIENISCFS